MVWCGIFWAFIISFQWLGFYVESQKGVWAVISFHTPLLIAVIKKKKKNWNHLVSGAHFPFNKANKKADIFFGYGIWREHFLLFFLICSNYSFLKTHCGTFCFFFKLLESYLTLILWGKERCLGLLWFSLSSIFANQGKGCQILFNFLFLFSFVCKITDH